MPGYPEHPELEGVHRLVGTWAIEASHPLLPGTNLVGEAVFEWLDDQQFLVQRSHFDHPEIPDALAVIGVVDGKPLTHYFDVRGTHRLFEVAITGDTWRYWNDAPGFSQRFTGTFNDAGDFISGKGELSQDDGATWDLDLTIAYRRTH
jgi:hypothetical protein